MSTTTVRVLLFGGTGGPDTSGALVGSLRAAIRLPGTLREETELVRADARALVVERADELLGIELGDALLAAWSTYRRLIRAAELTAADPGLRERVELLAHEADTTYRPRIDVLVDGVRRGTVNFELRLSFAVEALLVEVHGGAIVAVHAGRCVVTAELSCEDAKVAEPRSAEYLVPALVRLDRPYVLVRP
jgi:hypothetical protein